MTRRLGTFGRALAAILAGALAVRVIYTIAGPGNAYSEGPLGDFFFFHTIANLIADGQGFIAPYTLQELGQVEPTAEHPPLWPLVLAAASEVGGNGLLSHRLVGVPFGVATVGLLGLIGRRLGGETAGLVVAAIAACHPLLIGADGSLMSETLYGMLVAAALLLALRMLERPRLPEAALLGATIGLAALTRGEALALLPLLVAPAAWVARRGTHGRLELAAVAVAGAVLVIAPWTIRNWTTFDRPVLISTNDSTVLTGANCDATYRGRDLGWWRVDCRSPIRERNEAEQAAIWRKEGLEYAREHAGRLPVVIPARVLRTWGVYQPRRMIREAEGRDRTMEMLGTIVYFLLLVPAVYGAILLRRRRAPLWVLMVPPVTVTVVTVLGYGYTRFRHSADLVIVVLAGLALAHLMERRRAATEPASGT
ncbi:MAG TPA: glycosyltransferase family 39 protein [Thermoleophilaceae bacterium]